MPKSTKWTTDRQDPEDPLYTVFFTARNKDNKDRVEGFVQRKRAFLMHMPSTMDIPKKLDIWFDEFCSEGLPGEMCRMYISVNARDIRKIKKELMHLLIDDNLPGRTPIAHMESCMASIAMRQGMSAERKWLFDVDLTDEDKVDAFIADVNDILAEDYAEYLKKHPEMCVVVPKAEKHRTPHGYAVICGHGFDIRKLPDKWQEYLTRKPEKDGIDLKRDDLLCVKWHVNKDTEIRRKSQ